MNHIQSGIARYLHQNAHFLGEGKMQGQLYDLGRYPGAVYEPESTKWVFGHLFQLHDPKQIFPLLDQYEMIDPEHPERNEYIRRLTPVFQKHEVLDAWVYLYHQSIDGLVQIPNGNYLIYLRGNETHQDFIKSA